MQQLHKDTIDQILSGISLMHFHISSLIKTKLSKEGTLQANWALLHLEENFKIYLPYRK